jgi:hypothetical protein
VLAARAGLGAPNEIKVFTDEIVGYRRHSLEAHVNGAGGTLQVMPEYSYGLRPDWEASFQLPMGERHGELHADGFRVELQYVAPHDEAQGWYWGWNAEAGRTERDDEPHEWTSELVPIVGFRSSRWHLVANPTLALPLSGEGRKLDFQPAAKLAYRASGGNDFGIEFYKEASRLLFLTWDGKLGRSDVNLGIGRDLSGADWVVKLIVEIAFR